MTRWNANYQYANRGMELEQEIEGAIFSYLYRKIALIQKVPTPIKPVEVNYKKGIITKAFFEKKSTVDYIGNYRGRMIAFDAKETSTTNLRLANVEQHQYDHLKFNHHLGGISFLIVSFTEEGEVFYLPFSTLDEYWILSQRGGRKSIPYSDFLHEIKPGGLVRLDFIRNVDEYMKGEILRGSGTEGYQRPG